MVEEAAIERRDMFSRIGLVALVCALLVPVAYAGAGVQEVNRVKPKPAPTLVTLSVSCNPCSVGQVVHFSGSGYNPKVKAVVKIGSISITIPVASDGTISFNQIFVAPGSYTVSVYQPGHGNKLVLRSKIKVFVK